MLPTLAKTFLALGILTCLQSCCSLAALFCGPDRSEWVSELYRTPEAAVATFKEAARRSDKNVIYRALSIRYLERHKIGNVEVALAWERLEKQAPLHLLGQAEVQGPTQEPDGRLRFTLTVAGHELRLFVVEEDAWSVAYDGPNGDPHSPTRVIPDLADLVTVEGGSNPTEIRVTLDEGQVSKRKPWRGFRKESIREIRVGRDWKIDDFQSVSGSTERREPKGSGIDDQGG